MTRMAFRQARDGFRFHDARITNILFYHGALPTEFCHRRSQQLIFRAIIESPRQAHANKKRAIIALGAHLRFDFDDISAPHSQHMRA